MIFRETSATSRHSRMRPLPVSCRNLVALRKQRSVLISFRSANTERQATGVRFIGSPLASDIVEYRRISSDINDIISTIQTLQSGLLTLVYQGLLFQLRMIIFPNLDLRFTGDYRSCLREVARNQRHQSGLSPLIESACRPRACNLCESPRKAFLPGRSRRTDCNLKFK